VPIHILANLLVRPRQEGAADHGDGHGAQARRDYLDAPEATLVARPMLRRWCASSVAAGVVFGVV
jgi:hypothetical protein